MIRAKFKVQRIEAMSYDTQSKGRVEMRTVVLGPVYSQQPGTENKRFWEYTPSGEIRLGTINPEAWKTFELDREYYVDFTPAGDPT